MQTQTFGGQLEWCVIGLIRLCLSVRPWMHRWQKCQAMEIESTLSIVFGAPPPDAIRHRQRMLHLFAGKGSMGDMKWLVLTILPNGRWWLDDVVEIYVPPGTTVAKRHLAATMSAGMVRVLCGRNPPMWPRHRWVGHDLALEWIGMQEA